MRSFNNRKKRAFWAAAIIASVTLAGCGGGGSSASVDSTAGSGPDTTTPPASTSSNVVTSVPSATYAAGSEEAIAFKAINDLRGAMGVGLLAQNSKLDLAAKNHANFLIGNNLFANATYLRSTVNGIEGAHYEDSALPGFTGADPVARANYASYASQTIAEDVNLNYPAGSCAAGFLNSVYHLISFVGSYRDIGISAPSTRACSISMGSDTANGHAPQLPASGSVSVTPSNGQIGIDPTFYNQLESPTPAADIGFGTGVGHPVLVSLYSQGASTIAPSDVAVINFNMTTSDGVAVPARVLAAPGVIPAGRALVSDSNIQSAGYLVLLPIQPLAAATTYRVTFTGTLKGSVIANFWSFTTK